MGVCMQVLLLVAKINASQYDENKEKNHGLVHSFRAMLIPGVKSHSHTYEQNTVPSESSCWDSTRDRNVNEDKREWCYVQVTRPSSKFANVNFERSCFSSKWPGPCSGENSPLLISQHLEKTHSTRWKLAHDQLVEFSAEKNILDQSPRRLLQFLLTFNEGYRFLDCKFN